MGFDIYGMNPVLKKGSVKPERPDSSVDIYEDTDGAWSKYFELLAEYEDENPGIYFRANVWSWRPIVEFLCEHMDFLDQDEANDLSYNNGGIINSEKANRIAERIFDLDDIDAINQWVQHQKLAILMLDKESCSICEGTGVRDVQPMLADLEPFTKEGKSGYKCNGCDGEGVQEPFAANYPFSRDRIIEFGIFAKESGGFQIC